MAKPRAPEKPPLPKKSHTIKESLFSRQWSHEEEDALASTKTKAYWPRSRNFTGQSMHSMLDLLGNHKGADVKEPAVGKETPIPEIQPICNEAANVVKESAVQEKTASAVQKIPVTVEVVTVPEAPTVKQIKHRNLFARINYWCISVFRQIGAFFNFVWNTLWY